MSNYLNHLVSRNFGYTDQVKPRLPSLFEPLSETMGLSSALTGEETVSTITPVAEPTEWETSRPQPPRSQDIESSVLPPVDSTVASPKPRSQLTEQELSSSSQPPLKLPTLPNENLPAIPAPTSRAGQPEWLSETLVPPYSVTSSSPTSLPTSSLKGVDYWSESVTPSQSVTSSAHQLGILTERSEQPYPITPIIEPVPATSPPPSAVVTPRTPASVQPPPTIRPATVTSPVIGQITPRVRSLEGQAIAPPQPIPPAPTIHVTIGRIEVRAIPPASVPPKFRPASSVMNLDDYLRRRGGGK